MPLGLIPSLPPALFHYCSHWWIHWAMLVARVGCWWCSKNRNNLGVIKVIGCTGQTEWFKGRHQNLTKIPYLFSVKIEGGGGKPILSCKDSGSLQKRAPSNQINDLKALALISRHPIQFSETTFYPIGGGWELGPMTAYDMLNDNIIINWSIAAGPNIWG